MPFSRNMVADTSYLNTEANRCMFIKGKVAKLCFSRTHKKLMFNSDDS